MSLDNFWAVIDTQIAELETATSADDVIRILATDINPGYGDTSISSSPAFFAGSGGDKTVDGALMLAGWSVTGGGYAWTAIAPDGKSGISYTEGDIDRLEVPA